MMFGLVNLLGCKPREYDVSKSDARYDQARVESYMKIVFTSSWELRSEKLKNYEPGSKFSIHEQKSMVAFAFNYWVLAEKKLINKQSSFESQIKKSFLTNQLSLELLDDPLNEPFALSGPQLSAQEYKEFSARFKQFVIE